MKRLIARVSSVKWLAAGLSTAGLLAGCGSASDAGNAAVPALDSAASASASASASSAVERRGLLPSYLRPLVTVPGVTTGAPSSATLGPAGGMLASPDGRLHLVVPAGALAAPVMLSIQPVDNRAPGGAGAGYRLAPEAQAFAKPVLLRFGYADADTAGASPDVLGLAWRTAAGQWRMPRGVLLDRAAQTVALSVEHLGDWSPARGFRLSPASSTVKTGATLALKVLYCYSPVTPADDPVPVGYDCAPIDDARAPLLSPANTAVTWSVNGTAGGSAALGTLAGGAAQAIYTAPASVPAQGTVTVTATIPYGPAGTAQLASRLKIATDDYTGRLSVTVNSSPDGAGSSFSLAWEDFTLKLVETIPGDRAVFETAPTLVQATTRLAGCDPAAHSLTFTARLTVMDPVRSGPGDPLASKYGLVLDSSDIASFTTWCVDWDGARRRQTFTLGALLSGGILVGEGAGPAALPYADARAIAWSGQLAYPSAPGFTIDAAWSFQRPE